MNGWMDVELARQRREELLLEAEKRWLARAIRDADGPRIPLARRLLRLLRSSEGTSWDCMVVEDEVVPGLPLASGSGASQPSVLAECPEESPESPTP